MWQARTPSSQLSSTFGLTKSIIIEYAWTENGKKLSFERTEATTKVHYIFRSEHEDLSDNNRNYELTFGDILD